MLNLTGPRRFETEIISVSCACLGLSSPEEDVTFRLVRGIFG